MSIHRSKQHVGSTGARVGRGRRVLRRVRLFQGRVVDHVRAKRGPSTRGPLCPPAGVLRRRERSLAAALAARGKRRRLAYLLTYYLLT